MAKQPIKQVTEQRVQQVTEQITHQVSQQPTQPATAQPTHQVTARPERIIITNCSCNCPSSSPKVIIQEVPKVCPPPWGGVHPDAAPDNVGTYSIVREYDIMKKWMHIKKTRKYFPSIPRIIHQVWIGPISKAYCKWMDSFRVNFTRSFPKWKYKLWTKDLFEKKYGKMILWREYQRETYVESKADLLRYEIMWREGGIYMDGDSVWLNRSFDHLILNAKKSGMFLVTHDGKISHSNVEQGINMYMNGVFGVCKCHPAMEHLIRNIKLLYADLYHEQKVRFYRRAGPFVFSNVFRQFNVSYVHRNIFSPGSWFFQLNSSLTFDQNLALRMNQMKIKFPTALTFQVGFNTHGKPASSITDCKDWAQNIGPKLRNMSMQYEYSDDENGLVCSKMNYEDPFEPRPVPPTL